jgi:hypothetical protein
MFAYIIFSFLSRYLFSRKAKNMISIAILKCNSENEFFKNFENDILKKITTFTYKDENDIQLIQNFI